MNNFYFNPEAEKLVNYVMTGFIRIRTIKSQKDFMEDYKRTRLEGDSIINSIERAR